MPAGSCIPVYLCNLSDQALDPPFLEHCSCQGHIVHPADIKHQAVPSAFDGASLLRLEAAGFQTLILVLPVSLDTLQPL